MSALCKVCEQERSLFDRSMATVLAKIFELFLFPFIQLLQTDLGFGTLGLEIRPVEWVTDFRDPRGLQFLSVELSEVDVAEPRVVPDVEIRFGHATKALFRFDHQESLDEVLCGVGCFGIGIEGALLAGPLEVCLDDPLEEGPLVYGRVVVVEERIRPEEHLVDHDAEGPDICRFIVSLVQEDLRGLFEGRKPGKNIRRE